MVPHSQRSWRLFSSSKGLRGLFISIVDGITITNQQTSLWIPPCGCYAPLGVGQNYCGMGQNLRKTSSGWMNIYLAGIFGPGGEQGFEPWNHANCVGLRLCNIVRKVRICNPLWGGQLGMCGRDIAMNGAYRSCLPVIKHGWQSPIHGTLVVKWSIFLLYPAVHTKIDSACELWMLLPKRMQK